MSSCAGAGRGHSQTASPSWPWKYSTRWTACSVYRWGLAGGQESSLFHELGVWTFLWVRSFFWEFCKIWVLCSAITAWGLATQLVVGQWEKKVVRYHYCFLVLVFPLSHETIHKFYLLSVCPPYPLAGEGGKGWASGCLGLSYWLSG